MSYKYYVNQLSVLCTIVLSSTVWAEIQTLGEFKRFQQQSKAQLQQLQQQQRNIWLENHQYQPKAQNYKNSDLSRVCLPYKALRIVGVSLIDPISFLPKAGECLNEVRLNQLSRDLTAAYLAKGYIHNPFQFQDDHSGDLILSVIEGRVTKLSGSSERVNLSMLFPHLLGQPLRIQELDQGLDQANRLTSNNVTVDVLPAKNGEIELAFTNEQRSRISGFVGIDNNLSKIYHRWQGKLGLTLDSPLGLTDMLYLAANQNLASSNGNVSRSATFYYSVPYGNWTWNAFGSFSQFRTKVILQHSRNEQKGKTWQLGVKADYVLHRGSNHISSLALQLEKVNSRSQFNNSLIVLQSPILTTAQASLTHLQLFKNASLFVDVGYERGLPWWKADRNKDSDQPEAQFNRWYANAQFTQYHLGENVKLSHTHALFTQYSRNYLPAIKQADLLGRYAVRGFNDISFSAEKSMVLQNTLRWINEWENKTISPYVLLDIGIQRNTAQQSHSQKALGYGVGIQGTLKDFNFNLEWATGRLFASYLSDKHQESSVNFSANWHF